MTTKAEVAKVLTEDIIGLISHVIEKRLNQIFDEIESGVRSKRDSESAVPDGYALVPIEPTEEMIEAGCKHHECVQQDPWYSNSEISESDCIAIYKAMLTQATTGHAETGRARPPEGQGGES